MKKYLKFIPGLLIVCALVLAAVVPVHANPLLVQRGCFLKNNPATTSTSYMTAGNSTTTLTCDTYLLGSQNAGFSPDTANLDFFQNASSTASLTNINIEFSNNNVDWYQNALNQTASTSPVYNVGIVQSLQMQFASSTAGLGAVASNASTTSRLFQIPVPTRYVRAVFTVPVGSPPSAVWAEITTKQQVHE